MAQETKEEGGYGPILIPARTQGQACVLGQENMPMTLGGWMFNSRMFELNIHFVS